MSFKDIELNSTDKKFNQALAQGLPLKRGHDGFWYIGKNPVPPDANEQLEQAWLSLQDKD